MGRLGHPIGLVQHPFLHLHRQCAEVFSGTVAGRFTQRTLALQNLFSLSDFAALHRANRLVGAGLLVAV